MSMINDALRRASSASKTPPPPPSFGAVPPPPPPPGAAGAFATPPPSFDGADGLPPALEIEEPQKSGGNKIQVILAVALVFVVGIAVFINFWAKKTEAKSVDVSKNQGSKAILPNAAAARVQPPTNAIAQATAILSAVTNRGNPVAQVGQQAGAPAPAPAPAAPPQPPPKFPALKLQSIFYRPSSPSVMINGKTLFVDDEIQGVMVADIQPSSVTLVLSGHTNVLTLR
jgi:hypothetical protein